MTTALSTLRDDLSIMVGDYLHETVTTAIAASTSIVCTALANYRNSADYFNGWYVLITSENNDGTIRKISDDNGTTTLTVMGGNLTSDGANLATFELHRYHPSDKVRAINNAARELYSTLFKPLDNTELITGNIMPPFIWSSSSALKLYSGTNVTLAKTTTAGYQWNGETSAKCTASAGDGYISLHSDNYPRLLDLMDKEIDVKAWAHPEVADDGFLTIYTKQADATAQTLSSTTECPAGEFTLLELEDQELNDDLVEVEIRQRVHTNAKYVYFDPPRVMGGGVYEYLLPTDFQDGHLSQVWLQSSQSADDACDDLHPRFDTPVFGWTIVDDGTYKYLRFPYLPTSGLKIRLIGYCPLEDDLSADTDTMTLEAPYTQLLLAYAAYLMYEMQRGIVSGGSIERYDIEAARWWAKAEVLKTRYRMPKPTGQIHWSLNG